MNSYETQSYSMKRRLSDATEVAVDEWACETKRRCTDESLTSSTSTPEGRGRFDNTFKTRPEAKTIVGDLNEAASFFRGFSSPQWNFRTPGMQLASNPTALLTCPAAVYSSSGFAPQPSLPGCSEMSEQTMEEVQSSSHHQATPYESLQQMQRSNSAPDLYSLLAQGCFAFNPGPGETQNPQSRSIAEALVPFRASKGHNLF